MNARPHLLRAGRVLALAAFVVTGPLSAQAGEVSPAWTVTTERPIEWLRFLPSGVLVVSSDDALLGLNPADGTVRWRRGDLGNASQTAFEAAQQVAPLPGASQPTAAAAPTIRLMEQLPGGGFAAILADSGGRKSWFDVIDLQTGATVWSSTSLPLTEARGFLTFPDSTTILVHGVRVEPGRNHRLWLRVVAATGRVLWNSDSLLLESPAQFDASAMLASRGTVNGNQAIVDFPDSTALIYASADGLVRFDLASGRVLWRAAAGDNTPGPTGQGFAPMLLHGSSAFLPGGHKVHAIDLASGRPSWSSGFLPGRVVQMDQTAMGLLVRGQPIVEGGQMEGRAFLALLDPQSGKQVWRKQYGLRSEVSSYLIRGDSGYIASDAGLVRFALADGGETALTTGKLPGRPAVSLESGDSGLLVIAKQSLTLVAADGTQRYQTEYPAPTLGLGGRLLRLALAGAAIAGGAYYSGGYLAGSAVAKYQFSASRYASAHTYFVLKDHEGGGPALARVDKATGKTAGVISLGGDKTPEYVIEEALGLAVLLTDDKVLTAYRW